MPDGNGNLQAANPGVPSASNAPDASNAVDTRALVRRFGTLVAVDHMTVAVPHGSIFGLLGPNGAGKSTLIKMLTTLLAPSEGTAYVAEFDIVREPRQVRQKIGYVSQMLSADGDLTGYENLLISAKLYGIPRAERGPRIARALEFMKLAHVSNKLVKYYSGGMIRRLEIAQSMLHHPHVLFLDEPTVGLDPFAKRSVWDDIRDLQHEYGTTILMTTHDMIEADELCETVAFMHQGKLAVMGRPAELKAALGGGATLNDAFIHYTGAEIAEGGDLRDVARTRLTSQRLG